MSFHSSHSLSHTLRSSQPVYQFYFYSFYVMCTWANASMCVLCVYVPFHILHIIVYVYLCVTKATKSQRPVEISTAFCQDMLFLCFFFAYTSSVQLIQFSWIYFRFCVQMLYAIYRCLIFCCCHYYNLLFHFFWRRFYIDIGRLRIAIEFAWANMCRRHKLRQFDVSANIAEIELPPSYNLILIVPFFYFDVCDVDFL